MSELHITGTDGEDQSVRISLEIDGDEDWTARVEFVREGKRYILTSDYNEGSTSALISLGYKMFDEIWGLLQKIELLHKVIRELKGETEAESTKEIRVEPTTQAFKDAARDVSGKLSAIVEAAKLATQVRAKQQEIARYQAEMKPVPRDGEPF